MSTDNQKPEDYQPMSEEEAEKAWDNAPDADPAEFWLGDYPDRHHFDYTQDAIVNTHGEPIDEQDPDADDGHDYDERGYPISGYDEDGEPIIDTSAWDDEDLTPDPLDPDMKLASDEVLTSLAAKLNETPNADPVQAEFARLEAMDPDEALEALREKLKQKPTD